MRGVMLTSAIRAFLWFTFAVAITIWSVLYFFVLRKTTNGIGEIAVSMVFLFPIVAGFALAFALDSMAKLIQKAIEDRK